MKIICLNLHQNYKPLIKVIFLVQVKHAEEMKTFNLVPTNSYPQRIPVVDPLHAHLSSVKSQLFVIPWIIAHQSHLYMGFSRQEYWKGLPFPTPGDLPDPGIKPASLESPAFAGGFFHH